MAARDLSEAGRKALEAVRASRDYVLPHHHLLAATDPALLTAYDRYYTALTMDARALTMAEREIVWVALLAGTRIEGGAWHVRRGLEAGLTPAEIAHAAALAGWVEAGAASDFARTAYAEWVDADIAAAPRIAGFETARGPIAPGVARLATATVAASRRDDAMLAAELTAAHAAGEAAPRIAEALSYLMLHCGAPCFIHALQVWERSPVPVPYTAD